MNHRLLCLAAVLIAQSLPAQPARVPARPRLPVGADTNEAQAYYQFGRANLRSNPRAAAAAFAWAARLAPAWGDPVYAHAVASQLIDKTGTLKKLERWRSASGTSPYGERFDSLRFEAQLRNPFLFRGAMDHSMIQELLLEMGDWQTRITDQSGDPGYDGWVAYIRSDFQGAAKHYRAAQRRWPKSYGYYADRAEVFYQLRQLDSARVELDKFIAAQRDQDRKKLVRFYQSKAYGEYTVAMLEYSRDDTAAAEAAFKRALAEDISFHMAHVRLGELALARRDTTIALQELELAVQLKPAEVFPRYVYAMALLDADRRSEAAMQLAALVEMNPDFAMPYYHNGRLAELNEKPAEAVAHYQEFLRRAPRSMGESNWVRNRLQQLGSPAGSQ